MTSAPAVFIFHEKTKELELDEREVSLGKARALAAEVFKDVSPDQIVLEGPRVHCGNGTHRFFMYERGHGTGSPWTLGQMLEQAKSRRLDPDKYYFCFFMNQLTLDANRDICI